MVICRHNNHQFIVAQHPLVQFVRYPVALHHRELRLALDHLVLGFPAVELAHVQMGLRVGSLVGRRPAGVVQLRHRMGDHQGELLGDVLADGGLQAAGAIVESLLQPLEGADDFLARLRGRTTRGTAPENARVQVFFQLGDARTDGLLGDSQVFSGLVHAAMPGDGEDGIDREGIGNVAASNMGRRIVTIMSWRVHSFIVTPFRFYALPQRFGGA